MKVNITFLACVLTLTFSLQKATAQADGDYRSNLTSGNLWTTIANWQVYDGGSSTWIAATHYPTSADGVITIRTGDSVALTGSSLTTIDQVVINSTGILAIFLGTFTLNNGAGEDITVDGRLRLGTSTGILNGAGSILVNNGGQFYLRTSGRLQITGSTVNNGYVESDQNAFIENGSFTNNATGTFNWTGTTASSIALNNSAQFINNGTFQIEGAGTRTINSGTSNGTFTNSATGIINNIGGNTFTIASTVTFSNLGDIRGIGTNSFPATATNSGNISPGGSSGATLIVNGPFISAKPVNFNIQLLTTPGTGNDQLEVTSAVNVDLSSATLTIIDNASAPIGTYTIMTITSGDAGNFTGSFSTPPNIPSNFSNLTINAKSITIQKNAVLPLTWGSFTAREKNGKVALNWTTLQEMNVSHFVVEYSTDGQKFNSIGTVTATGNSSEKVSYSFEHSNPQHNTRLFYRLLEVDLDGKAAYSVIRSFKLNDNNSNAAIAIRSNPVENGSLLLESDMTDASAFITGINGAALKGIRLHQGINTINMNSLPAGIYTVHVYVNKNRIFSGKVVKK
jgi:hypothetical protein